MSNVVKAVVGVVVTTLGIITGSPVLLSLGVSLLLNAAASLFIKAPRLPPIAGIGLNYSGTLEPRRIVYGTVKTGGLNALPPWTSGPCHDHDDLALAVLDTEVLQSLPRPER